MTIASEITRITTNIANAYTAANNKGATIPASQVSDNLATCISSITTGITPSGTLSITANGTYDVTNYASADVSVSGSGITREVSASGVYQMPTSSFTFSLPSNATDVGTFAISFAFRDCASLTSVDLSSLTTVSGSYAMSNAFYNCTGLTSVDLSNLTTLSGAAAMSYAFQRCTRLTSVDLSSLTTVSGSYAMQYAFFNSSLTTLSFPALTSSSFGSCTNQFDDMLYCVIGCTVHFPSNLSSVIGSWSSVTKGFGGSKTTVLFDLTATL